MKKIILVFLSIILLSSPAYSEKSGDSARTEKYRITAENNIKILVNALELYANDHYRDYPVAKDFYSKKFDKYLLKVLGKEKADTDAYYVCPPSGKLRYRRSEKTRTYKLWCSHPEKYNLKALYFTPEEGFVKDTGKPVRGGIEVRKKEGS